MSNIILCADDSKTMQTVAEITFRVSDYTYVGAMSADEAIQKAREQKPALILADAVMPGKTGYELCKMIKADPALADVPVFMLCGNSEAYDAAKGSDAGADGHLTKPWDTQVMLDKVGEILGKGGAARPAPSAAASAGPKAAAPQPKVKPKPPILPSTPTPATPTPGKPGEQQPGAQRTHTIMGMPTVMPPKPQKPAAAKPPAASALKPLAEPLPPRSPTAKPGSESQRMPTAKPTGEIKPPAVKTPRPKTPAPPAPPTVPAVKPAAAPQAPRPTKPGLAVPSDVPSKYAPPAKKSVITQPGVPEPPLPATPEPQAPAAQPPAAAKPAAKAPAAPTAKPAQPAAKPAQPAAKPAQPAAAAPMRRPPMIKGKPTKRPAFQPPQAVRAPADGQSGVDGKIAAATRSAVANAAQLTGLDPNGPEMKALLALSKDVVERVVWEVVPDLAETIIRENLDRLAKR